MHSERRAGRPVAIAWNRQPNTSASRRNAAVWRNRQKTEQHQRILEEMARAWEKLAKETDLEDSYSQP
jgi:hypothetical protein